MKFPIFRDLFASRKFRSALAGTIVVLVARIGFSVSPDVVYGIVTLFGAHIFGVALEDAAEKSVPLPEMLARRSTPPAGPA